MRILNDRMPISEDCRRCIQKAALKKIYVEKDEPDN